jgi:glutamine amidotransferase
MCLAIYQPSGVAIPESHLLEGFKNNPHGAGFMYFDETGKVQVYKSMHYDAFIDEYEAAWALHGSSSPFAVHFRWATHGTTDINNVHPFKMNENVAVLHNGIIDCVITDKSMSDTAAFVRDYLGAMPRNWQDNEFLFDMVQDYTRGSKLVIMTSDPQAQYSAYIVNEQLGHWADGVWYSNGSYSCSRGSVVKSAKISAETFEQDSLYSIIACELCGEESVLDDVCYNCESCMVCYMEEEHCNCEQAVKFHAMTNDQFVSFYGE